MKAVRHSAWRRVINAAGPLLALVACEQAVTSNAAPDPNISMVVVSGNQQTGMVDTELSAPLVVRVVNASGSVVRGQVVNWRVLDGGGEVYAGVGVTDSNGLAQERWKLGPNAGVQRVEARAINSSTGEKLTFGTFTATAVTDTATMPAPPQPGPLTLNATNVNADTFSIAARWGRATGAVRYDWSTGGNSGSWARSGQVTDTVVTYYVPRSSGETSYWMCVYSVNSAGIRSSDATCGNYAPPTTGGSTPTPVASVSLSPANPSVQTGSTVQLTATLRDANNNVLTGRTITWSSSNTAVATVNATGLVTGVVAGSATITATSEGRTGTTTVTVTAAATPASVATVTVSPSANSIQVGGTAQLTATLRDASNNILTGRVVTWSSSNSSVASVNSSGLVSAVAAGSATITASSETRTGTATVTVTAPPPSTGAVFVSNWSTATGNTETAVRDGGRWNQQACGHTDVLQVVSGAALGWTATPNVLRVTNPGAGRCWQIQTTAVPKGVSYYIRFYAMVESGSGSNFHPTALEIWGTQAAPWSLESVGSTWQMATRMGKLPYADYAWKTPALQLGTWYRFEYYIELLPNQRARIWPRVYDMSGTLLADANSMRHIDGGSRTLAQMYASGTAFTYDGGQAGDPARAIANFAMGYADDAGGNNQRWYHAAVELRTDTWAGPIR